MSWLKQVLQSGHFAVTAEVGPPKGSDPQVIRKKCNLLKGFVDAVNITDNQTAIVRMSSFASCLIAQEQGIEPVMQMVTRDRNRIALQSDFLGACALGIPNLLCLTGDHQSMGNHPQSKNVYDIDSIQLLQIFKNMRDQKVFQNGEEVKGEMNVFLGAGESPYADPLEFRALRLAKKIAAGAEFIQTQAIFDVDIFTQWMEEVCRLGLHKKSFILAGVIPVKSAKALRYMKNEVPGVVIPDSLIERMEAAVDQKAEGVEVCIETIQKVAQIEGVSGVHIMAIAWESIVPEIVQRSGLLPRPAKGEITSS
ncbi:MAG TPA: 5,10-methylenetetrahydrofolate reductase [Candidatus Atribacteria bacterium]|nr:5,10-methylenetetrahydrofolate reductase [Candidatus Atribacteria bacterium]HCU21480.1 5,10-methylenetetrahydrofolate reductase [Candidatus Atribacteria bacterium]